MSHNQPGPYGQQPPQPPGPGQRGPYAAPGPGPAPSGPNPYAQPGGAPGYGYPPQGPSHPAPPGQRYGTPPPSGAYGRQQSEQPPGEPGSHAPVPPRRPARSRGRKAGAIVAGVVAAVVVAGAVSYVLSGGEESIGADDGTRYDLTLPQSFGAYTLLQEGDTTRVVPDEEELAKAGVEYTDSVGGVYGNLGPEAAQASAEDMVTVNFGGMWGEVRQPQQAVDALFAELVQTAANDPGMTLDGGGESFSDESVAMRCEVGEGTDPESQAAFSGTFCVWADYSTVGVASYLNLGSPADFNEEAPALGDPLPTADAAASTKELREAAQVERGAGGA